MTPRLDYEFGARKVIKRINNDRNLLRCHWECDAGRFELGKSYRPIVFVLFRVFSVSFVCYSARKDIVELFTSLLSERIGVLDGNRT